MAHIEPFYDRDGITIYVGDNRDVLPHIGQVSAVVTDPPYGLSFMGKGWDHAVPGVEFWQAIGEAMLPGAHLLAFGGTRTYHRMAVAIEDAGYEIRDTLQWLYGSGFPKSHDVSKAIDKMMPRIGMFAAFAGHFAERRAASGLTQKAIAQHFPSRTGGMTGCVWNWENGANVPTVEQWHILQPMLDLSDEWTPLIERVEAEREVIGKSAHKSGIGNAVKGHYTVGGTIAEHVDITAPATPEAERWQGWGTALKPAYEPIIMARRPFQSTVAANVLQHGTGAINVDASRIATDDNLNGGAYAKNGTQRDDGWGMQRAGAGDYEQPAGRWPANVILDEAAAESLDAQSAGKMHGAGSARGGQGERTGRNDSMFAGDHEGNGARYGDTGGASRFFYCAKSSRRERNAGLDGMPERVTREWRTGNAPPNVSHRVPDKVAANHHPTVKPLALMRYLIQMVTPPEGIVLDPFAGSGSTLVAAAELGFQAIGIELSEEYAEIAARRVDHALNERAGRLPLEGVA